MLDVRRLRVLSELAAVGSFSGTARALGYTQSAISQHIATLERECGLQLVERGTRPIRLTDAGGILVATAEPIFGHLANAETAVRELAGLRASQIRIAGFPTACSTILPPAIAGFRDEHPDIEISVVEAEPSDAAQALKAGRIDLAIAYTYPTLDEPDDRALEHTVLITDRFRLVLPRNHRLLTDRALRMSALAAEPWIAPPATGPSRSYRTMLSAVCRAEGFEPRIAFEIEDIRAAQGLVGSGLGIALVPNLALEGGTPDQVEIREVAPAPPLRRIVTMRLPGPAPIAAMKLLQTLQQAARRFGADDPGAR